MAVVDLFYDPAAPMQPNQFAPEFTRLLAMVAALRPAKVLEVGTFTGGTLWQWLGCMQPGGYLVAVDLPGARWGMPDTADPTTWHGWGRLHQVRVIPVLADSHVPATVGAVHSFAPFDFVFLDGDHTYAGVRQDFEQYGRLVRPGGLLALHDIVANPAEPDIEVWRLWQEIEASGLACETLLSGPGQQERGIGVCHF